MAGAVFCWLLCFLRIHLLAVPVRQQRRRMECMGPNDRELWNQGLDDRRRFLADLCEVSALAVGPAIDNASIHHTTVFGGMVVCLPSDL